MFVCVCVIQTNLRVTASYRVEAITGDTAASFSYHHHTRHITQKGNKTCNLDPFPYSLKYKIQVQLKFQILVTSGTFLYNVTICYLQVVLSHLIITMQILQFAQFNLSPVDKASTEVEEFRCHHFNISDLSALIVSSSLSCARQGQ